MPLTFKKKQHHYSVDLNLDTSPKILTFFRLNFVSLYLNNLFQYKKMPLRSQGSEFEGKLN